MQRIEKNVLVGHLKYNYSTPGKYELVGRFESDVEFELRAVDTYQWRLTYFPDKSTDHIQMRNIIVKTIGNKGEIAQPQLKGLSQAKRIEFYDLFLTHSHAAWSLVDVKGVKVKEPEPEMKDYVDTESDDSVRNADAGGEGSEVETRILGSIQEAILKGENLRTNPFVKQFEQDGYYFQSMTFRYEHSKSPLIIDLIVDFKLKPSGLEIAILQSFERVDGRIEECSLGMKQKTSVLESFWSVANALLNSIRRNVASDRTISTPQ